MEWRVLGALATETRSKSFASDATCLFSGDKAQVESYAYIT